MTNTCTTISDAPGLPPRQDHYAVRRIVRWRSPDADDIGRVRRMNNGLLKNSFTAVEIDNCPDFYLSFGGKTDQYLKNSQSRPDYEPWTTQIFIKMLSESPRFLDIGANVGWYSCIAS